MCGIAGIVCGAPDRTADPRALAAMTAAISHRGPDDVGYYNGGPVALGHRRLSVIDLNGGHQPMTHEATGRVMVFNGEIYNYRDIRSRLQGAGTTFATNSDTEVLLRLAQVRETGWLHELNGMYALALWDRREQTLLLARDRFGVKPLYYAIHDGCFLFGSEIKAILAYPGFPTEVNERRIPEYLAFRNLAGCETFFRGIHMVPAGHVMRIEPGLRVTTEQFWSEHSTAGDGGSAAPESVDARFADRFADAVRHRLVSDVPIGTFNSGGVDSSIVTQSVRRQTSGELHTFSVGFDEASYDERRYADGVAQRLGTHHHTLVMRRGEYADALEQTIWHMDEPLAHAHSVPLLMLSRFAKQYVTVVLTGEGADETFAGYPRYQVPLIAHQLGKGGAAVKAAAGPVGRAFGLRRMTKLLEVVDSWQRSVIDGSRFAPASDLGAVLGQQASIDERVQILDEVFRKDQTFLESVLEYDRRTYLPALLVRLDKTTMASGLEARVPFLDYRMVQWSKTLPAQHKTRVGRTGKVMLKRIAAEAFPQDAMYRRKVGFGVPVGEWLRDPASLGRFQDVLRDATFRQRDYCRPAVVTRLLDDHLAGRGNHADTLWPILNVELWRRQLVTSGTVQ